MHCNDKNKLNIKAYCVIVSIQMAFTTPHEIKHTIVRKGIYIRFEYMSTRPN